MDEDYDVEDGSFAAAAPPVRSAAPSGSLSPPPMLAPPPGANAEQRRMVDMMNNRAMQMYRQVVMDRRSSENRQAVMDRQEAGRAFRARQSDLAAERVQDRMDQRAVYESDRRDQTERSRIAAEERRTHQSRMKDDPDYRRDFEFAQINARAGGERAASRGRLLDTVQDQQPSGYAALPIGMQGRGGLRNPAVAMQMPTEATRPADTEQALDLTFKREFAAPAADKVEAMQARDRSNEEVDTVNRRADSGRLDSQARSRPSRQAFRTDFDDRIAPYQTALDSLLKEGQEEVKSGRVDEALLPKLDPKKDSAQRARFLDVVDRVAGMNDVNPETVTRALFGMTQMVNEANAPRVLPNGMVEFGGTRFVMDSDTFRMVALMRAERTRAIEQGRTSKELQKRARVQNSRQEVDETNRRATGVAIDGVMDLRGVPDSRARRRATIDQLVAE